MIDFDGVRKVYDPDVVAVDEFTATIDEGEWVSILGPSGCGKSTILFMAGGFLERTAGTITVNGHSVEKPDPERGMVFQDSVLFPWMTIKENIEWGMETVGIEKATRKQRAQEYIEMIGLEGFEDAYPSSLSGGMKQRAAMARVLVVNPDVLLMDEPLGALDEQTRELMQHELLDIWSQTGQTCLFVTHSIDEAVYLSDRVIVLTDRPSRIKADVDMTDVFDRPRDPEIKETQAFTDKRREIWELIKSEVTI